MPSNKSDRWTCIVIHHSATDEGNAERFDRMHKAKGWDELGYDFVIGNGTDTRDGQVEVGPRWPVQNRSWPASSPGDCRTVKSSSRPSTKGFRRAVPGCRPN